MPLKAERCRATVLSRICHVSETGAATASPISAGTRYISRLAKASSGIRTGPRASNHGIERPKVYSNFSLCFAAEESAASFTGSSCGICRVTDCVPGFLFALANSVSQFLLPLDASLPAHLPTVCSKTDTQAADHCIMMHVGRALSDAFATPGQRNCGRRAAL